MSPSEHKTSVVQLWMRTDPTYMYTVIICYYVYWPYGMQPQWTTSDFHQLLRDHWHKFCCRIVCLERRYGNICITKSICIHFHYHIQKSLILSLLNEYTSHNDNFHNCIIYIPDDVIVFHQVGYSVLKCMVKVVKLWVHQHCASICTISSTPLVYNLSANTNIKLSQ